MPEPIELDEFLKYKPPALEIIISHGILFQGCKVIIYGKYKSLKSMLATRLCMSIAQGKPWVGFDTVKSSVMYLQLEIPNPLLQNRIFKMVYGNTNISNNGNSPITHHPLGLDAGHEPLYIWTEPTIKIDTDIGFKRIEEQIIKYKPKVLVIDPIYKIVSGDLLNTQHIQKLTDWVDLLISKYGLSIVLVHHTRKGAYEEWGSDDMLGSVIFSAWADTIIKIERKPDDKVLLRFDVVRHATDEISNILVDVDRENLNFIAAGRII